MSREKAQQELEAARIEISKIREENIRLVIERVSLLQYAKAHDFAINLTEERSASIVRVAEMLCLERLAYSPVRDMRQEWQEILAKQFRALDNLYDKVTAKGDAAAETIVGDENSVKERLRNIDNQLLEKFVAVVAVSSRVGNAKKVLSEGEQVSCIVPSREKIVFESVFKKIQESLILSQEAVKLVTQWYRCSIAGSIKAQQDLGLFVPEGDVVAELAAREYLPGFQILRESGLAVERAPSEVVLFTSSVSAHNAAFTEFELFPAYSPHDASLRGVKASAMLGKGAAIEPQPAVSR